MDYLQGVPRNIFFLEGIQTEYPTLLESAEHVAKA